MRTIVPAILSVALLSGSARGQRIPSPSDHLGMDVGADRALADYRQIRSYFKVLDELSGRVRVESLGSTTLGEEMIMAVISSEANLRDIVRMKEIARALADPRNVSPEEAEALVREGKPIVLVVCNIHSTEIASSQMAMEWAHALAVADDPETERRLDEVVLLLVPSLNPDGQIMETEWYREHLGTPFEGGRMPWLYHHYVGHDNNRDWFMLTQVETRNMNWAMYHEWFPQVLVDVHQMGSSGPRMFIPPFADPLDAEIHPLIWREINLIGSNMAYRLEQAGKAGVIYGYSYDAYWIGGTRNTPWWKNITGLLLEVASARIASPIHIDPGELRGGRKGLVEYGAQINHPNPWPGGWWRLGDIMEYERVALDALLEVAAERGDDLLRDMYERAGAAIDVAEPEAAYRIPADQRDPSAARRLADLLLEHNVEVREDADGDRWIPLRQPFSRLVRELLEPQRYPEIEVVRGADPLRPYDVASWTLPLMMGVEVERTEMDPETSSVRLRPGGSASFVRRSEGREVPVRVGVYKPWLASMDEGWTRWVLEQHGYDVTSLHNEDVQRGNLDRRVDAIILPDIDRGIIAEGKPRRESDDMKYWRDFPPRYRGGLGETGANALRDYVESGGTLIAFDSSSDYVIETFNVPVRNTLANASGSTFASPGSLLRVRVEEGHPVTRGLPAEVAVFLSDATAFETTAPGAEMERWVLARYPDDSRDILLSGWIRGADELERRAAAVAMTYGEGKIVLFGFRPQHRGQTQATFPFVFNALEWSVAD